MTSDQMTNEDFTSKYNDNEQLSNFKILLKFMMN